jgi:LysR family glycine cleavage system transcriptional activator
MMDFSRDGIDVAVRFGYGPDEGLFSMPLADEWVAPVMAPELVKQFPTPESLTKAPLIIDHSVDFLDPPAGWAEWFAAMDVDGGEIHGVQFSQGDHAVDAALSGAGVVLGRRAFVVKEIYEGRLVMPFKTALGTGARFRFLCSEGVENQPKIKAFREWMIAEIRKTKDITAGLKIIHARNRR